MGRVGKMKLVAGLEWAISCTTNFQETVAFFRDVMGLEMAAQGVATVDTQFTRYVQLTLPGGDTFEVVEPRENARDLYRAPIVTFTVDDLAGARRELEQKQVEFVAPIFIRDDGWGWTYFRAPDGNIYQLQGAYRE